MNGRKKEKTEHIVTKLKKVQQTKLLVKWACLYIT